MRRAAGIVLATLAIFAATPGGAAAAQAHPVGEVTLYLSVTKGGHSHIFQVNVFPLRGLATVDTTVTNAHGIDRERGVAYAVAIPPAPFEGSLDVHFPGLGRFVGTISTEREGTARCRSGRIEEGADFNGRIDFHGSGGYASWSATKAKVGVTRSCTPLAAEPATRKDLSAAFGEFGPVLSGPVPFRLFAHSPGRALEFIAWGAPSHDRGTAQFVAVDREWLPGEVAVQRWVNRLGVQPAKTVEIGPGGDHPATVVFRPPAPFFGTGRYDRTSHTLTGSLGVNFLGLRLRLARPPLVALLEDEEIQPR